MLLHVSELKVIPLASLELISFEVLKFCFASQMEKKFVRFSSQK
jgi:hypothetical protein